MLGEYIISVITGGLLILPIFVFLFILVKCICMCKKEKKGKKVTIIDPLVVPTIEEKGAYVLDYQLRMRKIIDEEKKKYKNTIIKLCLERFIQENKQITKFDTDFFLSTIRGVGTSKDLHFDAYYEVIYEEFISKGYSIKREYGNIYVETPRNICIIS